MPKATFNTPVGGSQETNEELGSHPDVGSTGEEPSRVGLGIGCPYLRWKDGMAYCEITDKPSGRSHMCSPVYGGQCLIRDK